MRRMIWLFLASMVALLGTSLAVAQQQSSEQPLSKVDGTIRVTGDPASGLTNVVLLTRLLMDDQLVDQSVAQVSRDAAKSSKRVAAVDAHNNQFGLPPRAEVILFVTVSSFDERLPAKKVLQALCSQLSFALQAFDAQHQIDTVRLKKSEEDVLEADRELSRERDAYVKQATLMNAATSAEDAAKEQLRLDIQVEAVEVELQGLEARQNALQDQIADMGRQVRDNAAQDPVVVELEKAVKIRQQIVESQRELHKLGTLPQKSLLTAESELAEHQAELAKFRREATQAAGGQRITELRRRLDDTAIEMAEKTAKRNYLMERKKNAPKYSSQIEQKRTDIEMLERQYREMLEERANLRRKLQLYQSPNVTLISAK
jgi:hypothetical protein